MKKLLIDKIQKVHTDTHTRLEITLSSQGDVQTLWFETEKKWGEYLCDDRCDGIIVCLFMSALRSGYDVIESNLPLSEKLYYQLNYQILPEFYSLLSEEQPKTKIVAPTTREKYHKGTNSAGMGMSGGVDSFATLREYESIEFEDYKITHLAYNNAGAHHGKCLVLGVRSELNQDELFEGQRKKIAGFSQEHGYNLIVTNSNLAEILNGSLFVKLSFDRTHTFRNAGIALLFSRLYNKYYYSSTHTLDKFKFSFSVDCSFYEKLILPLLSTENIEFYNSNQNWTRQKKLKEIIEFDKSYDRLTVCLLDIDNCGICMKCKRTLMALDVLGDDTLEKYRNSFDVDKYRREYREKWFREIHAAMQEDVGLVDVYNDAVLKGFSLVVSPDSKTNLKALPPIGKVSVGSALLRKEHSLDSARIATLAKETIVQILEVSKTRTKVNTGNHVGWVNADFVERLITQKGVIVINRAIIRSTPSLESAQVTTLSRGDQVHIMGMSADKTRIHIHTGNYIGWTNAEFVK